MTTIFVATRKELTALLLSYQRHGYDCYRVRIKCDCKSENQKMYPTTRQRNGILVICDNHVLVKVVRCKNCAKLGV